MNSGDFRKTYPFLTKRYLKALHSSNSMILSLRLKSILIWF